MTKKPDVAFDSKKYFANYYGKGLSYFDQPFDRSFEAKDFQACRDLVYPNTSFKTFLDLGAADGRAMAYAAKMHKFDRLDGIELSAEAVARKPDNCNIVHGDVIEVLSNLKQHKNLLPKYDVILASLLMYFDRKSLAHLLKAIPKVCHKDTLLLFPFDPDRGDQHGYQKGKYKIDEPEAFVSLYRPLAWWHHELNRAGFEIVYYKDPNCPVYRYKPSATKGIAWRGAVLGDPTVVHVEYVDGDLARTDPDVIKNWPMTRSVMRLTAAGYTIMVGLRSERDGDDTVYYWESLIPTITYNDKQKTALAHIRAYLAQMSFGGGILRLQPYDQYQVIPGFFPLENKRKKTWTQESDVQL